MSEVFLIGLLVVVIMTLFCVLLFMGLRYLRVTNAQPMHSQTDLTNMMILFQTMRDILDQQKELARQFNASLDKRVKKVRNLVESAEDVRSELRRTRRQIAAMLEESQSKLVALERRMDALDAGESSDWEETQNAPADTEAEATPATTEAPVGIETLEELEPMSEESLASEELAAAAQAPETAESDEEELKSENDFLDTWTGLDFGDTDADTFPPEEESESPEDSAAARDAFRSLLDMGPQGVTESAGDMAPADQYDNGDSHITPVQKRIYEYSDAGMKVPEIARELGLGKGEVRLILSLRRGQVQ